MHTSLDGRWLRTGLYESELAHLVDRKARRSWLIHAAEGEAVVLASVVLHGPSRPAAAAAAARRAGPGTGRGRPPARAGVARRGRAGVRRPGSGRGVPAGVGPGPPAGAGRGVPAGVLPPGVGFADRGVPAGVGPGPGVRRPGPAGPLPGPGCTRRGFAARGGRGLPPGRAGVCPPGFAVRGWPGRYARLSRRPVFARLLVTKKSQKDKKKISKT